MEMMNLISYPNIDDDDHHSLTVDFVLEQLDQLRRFYGK
jgi:hypothetical protein